MKKKMNFVIEFGYHPTYDQLKKLVKFNIELNIDNPSQYEFKKDFYIECVKHNFYPYKEFVKVLYNLDTLKEALKAQVPHKMITKMLKSIEPDQECFELAFLYTTKANEVINLFSSYNFDFNDTCKDNYLKANLGVNFFGFKPKQEPVEEKKAKITKKKKLNMKD